ncbi:MAG: maltotransferase domain-containing protein [Janthinobacterium lividum]
MENRSAFAPRIYYLHPLLIGSLTGWDAHFARAERMGFDHVLLAPPFMPGALGDVFSTADHRRLHPCFANDSSAVEALARLAEAARARGLSLLVDAVIDRVAADAGLRADNPGWFLHADDSQQPDPRRTPLERHTAYANFGDAEASEQLTEWWSRQLLLLVDAGVDGFRFDAPEHVPAHIWRRLGGALRARHPRVRMLAWTPGLPRERLNALTDAGFDSVFSSFGWWDFRADWLTDELAALRRVGAPIAFPEAPFEPRLAQQFQGTDAATLERAYRRALTAAATLGTGWMMPMGFEYAASQPLSRTHGGPDEFARARTQAPFDLCELVAEINTLAARSALLQGAGQTFLLSSAGNPVASILRVDGPDARRAGRAALLLINADLERSTPVSPARLLDGIPGGFTRFLPLIDSAHAPSAALAAQSAGRVSMDAPDGAFHALRPFALAPGEVRVFEAMRAAPVLLTAPVAPRNAKATERRQALQATRVPRIAIEAVSPEVDAGRFPAKRVVGEWLSVEADIFMDGHDRIAASVLWRPAQLINAGRAAGASANASAADTTDGDTPSHAAWHRTPMRALGNDRWGARIPLDRIGYYEYTVEAWRDTFGSLVDHIGKKLRVGQSIALELQEAAHLLHETAHAAPADSPLHALAKTFAAADAERQTALVSAPASARAFASAGQRDFAVRHPQTLRVAVERAAARFASWYELFPRSMSGDATRHGTFIDVIGRLDAIQSMGFDVLYFPPIHPIGLKNRKGPNNTLKAGPDDVGSPYAIGGAEGGHQAIHPELGSFDDFKTLIEAARAHGLELALDFAIQCSPDHPWLAEHPTWFAWRPDGTLRFAENPPKKYEDIVNPEFYAADALPALWLALRDVILFWVAAGIKTFRVDNPHTKPLPFWEWMIAEVRGRHPDVLFLSEAFTRPKLMNRLAKVGFSQSYSYFTWRETKQELTEYLTELTQTPAREYFRPNFFVNTPDINPRFLQSSGRAGFVIRAALAATLSGLWGVYSGFELCEARPLPGSEEYADSEKYQLRAWNWEQPGNIVGEISLLNRIRRDNPALHGHLGINFLGADNERILYFEKATPSRDNVLLIAICLDPFAPQEASIELPLWKWGLSDNEALQAEDLVSGERFEMRGKYQRIRLDPATLPFAIRRVRPSDARLADQLATDTTYDPDPSDDSDGAGDNEWGNA